ncbi:MAG: PAS domain-containing sensor histidine kinase [Desulfobacterales bacterium]
MGRNSRKRRVDRMTPQQSKSYLKAVLDNVLDGIVSIGEDGIVQTFNPAAERIFGRAADEVVGQNVKILMPEPYGSAHDGFIRNYLRTGRAKIIGIGREVEGLRSNGEIFPLNIAVSEMWHEGKREFIGIVRDVTDLKKAEKAHRETDRKLSTLMANLPGMAYRRANDPHWTFEFASEGCRQLTGYEPWDLIGNRRLSYNDIIHPDDRENVREEVRRALRDKTPFQLNYRIRTHPVGEKWVYEQGVGVFSQKGNLLAIEGLVIDDTVRVRAEEALRRLNRELEQRISERTFQLQEANQALEASLDDLRRTQGQLVQTEKMAALGELVSGVAHEINTPVGICVTAASWMRLKLDEMSARIADSDSDPVALKPVMAALNEAAASIQTNLERAANLVKSFKQVAVDQATEDRRRFNLKEYLETVLLSLRPKYKKSGHVLEVECPDTLEVVSYPGVFSQILTNLVMNSLVHGFEDLAQGRITISASTADGQVVLRYRDDGRGMSAETLRKMYDPFFTTRRNFGGSGLGMHIVYQLVVRRLNGRIVCESAPGRGTAFTITFPLESPSKESGDDTHS